jgi:protein-S-isoprenylcysteine O-methyltransferase Ste14
MDGSTGSVRFDIQLLASRGGSPWISIDPELLERTSDGARTATVLLQLIQLAGAFAILDRSGTQPGRVAILALFAGVLWTRLAFRVNRLPRDTFGWWDALVATIASAPYLVGFAALGAGAGAPLPVDSVAVALFAAGLTLSAGADAFRAAQQARQAPLDALCTQGPYALVRHPKYLGDLTWASGWALATHSAFAWAIVGVHATILVLVYIPALERRLAGRHGAAYRAWARGTPRLIPFVY